MPQPHFYFVGLQADRISFLTGMVPGQASVLQFNMNLITPFFLMHPVCLLFNE